MNHLSLANFFVSVMAIFHLLCGSKTPAADKLARHHAHPSRT